MKRTHRLACPRLLLLLLLFLTTAQPVKAERSNQNVPSPVVVELKTLNFPQKICTGATINLKFGFLWKGAPPLVPSITPSYDIKPQGGSYTWVNKPNGKVQTNKEYTFSVKYTAKEPGDGSISVAVTMAGRKSVPLKISFKINDCDVGIQYNMTTTLSSGMIAMTNDYFGSGSLSADDNGQITGSGTQAIWSDILPYSAEGASCQHTPPWESNSGLTFSGQMGDDGETQVTMDLEALSVNASELTCTGEDSSGSMPFPGYTYSSCQITLAGFDFEANTLDVPFNCPGEEPYNVPITVIPRRKS